MADDDRIAFYYLLLILLIGILTFGIGTNHCPSLSVHHPPTHTTRVITHMPCRLTGLILLVFLIPYVVVIAATAIALGYA